MFTESVQPARCSIALGTVLLAYYLVPYLRDPHDYRRRFSGPWLAAFTNWWMSSLTRTGRHSELIKELHNKYGTFVRIGPDHISIADPDALEVVYGHSSGLLKSDFYKAFDLREPGMFSVQDRVEHTRKRKRVANIFSQQSIIAFELRVQSHIQNMCAQLDMRCKQASQGVSGSNWVARDGKAVINCCPQFLYLSFDIIGDLALGSPFGMVEAQRDATPITQLSNASQNASVIPIARAIAEGGKTIMSIGAYPSWMHMPLQLLPWHLVGLWQRLQLFRVAITAVSAKQKRVAEGFDDGKGVDVMDKMLEVRNEDGSPLSKMELVSEALLMIVAGGDTTSHTLSALCYYLAINPHFQRQLQEELDHHIPPKPKEDEDQTTADAVVEYEHVKNLPYLNACVKEALRLYSTIGTGLPRIVPPGKTFTYAGEMFNAGSIISVPSFTTNRSNVWGTDGQEFRPNRWLEDRSSSLNKYFVPFSVGPRACLGRNLAQMNMLVITATVFRRYSFEALPNTKLLVHETLIREATSCEVAIKRRGVTNWE